MPSITNKAAALAAWAAIASGASAGLTSWTLGDPADVTTPHEPGLLLAGGGDDNDDAMRWFLQRAGGGDVVVLRASGTDAYNPYLFSQLGVAVDSVQTFLVPTDADASDPVLIEAVDGAEALFIAGGDQTVYVNAWRDTPLEDAINRLIEVKSACVGGTSAGMMILSNAYYHPQTLGVLSSEALSNPYHPFMDSISLGGFIRAPRLERVITDTHFDDRDRRGRLVTFMARLRTDRGLDARAIACDEFTAIAIDGDGIARVFGETPDFPDDAYFISTPCAPPESDPETCEPGQPLTWDANGQAVHAQRIPGTTTGANGFDLNTWTPTGTSEPMRWWAQNGTLLEASGGLETSCACPGDCDGSGTVDFNDLVAMLFAFGESDTPACDPDGSGTVDFNDLVAALFLFGECG